MHEAIFFLSLPSSLFGGGRNFCNSFLSVERTNGDDLSETECEVVDISVYRHHEALAGFGAREIA